MAGLRSVDVGRLRGRAVTRDPDEPYRASTPLELFFDLTFVVAVARASAALHHELVAGHVAEGVWGFVGVFFAVWWAWMNATWFASAHDADDVPYRLLMLVQMAGVLVVATGVTDALEHDDWLVVTIGYAVMRVGLAVSWLRVARDEPAGRTRALRYAAGISVLQVLWFARLALPHGAAGTAGFLVLVAAELAVPVWAERAAGAPVFHAGHIEERYGLFTIIVLGESVLSASAGFQAALDEGGLTAELFAIGVGGLLLAFTSWWLYFDHPGHMRPRREFAFRWGYAHVVIFASLAAMGAGLQVATEAVTGHGVGAHRRPVRRGAGRGLPARPGARDGGDRDVADRRARLSEVRGRGGGAGRRGAGAGGRHCRGLGGRVGRARGLDGGLRR